MRKIRALVVAALCLAVAPVASSASADSVAQSKPKPTKESVAARRAKLAKASTETRILAKETAPSGLNAEQKKVFDAEMAKLAPLVEANDKVVAQLDKGLADPKANIDSLSEMGESQQLKMQMAMDRMSTAMQQLSNLLKKISDTAQTISQNLK
ncbi:MAG: hypothetical protein HOV80_16150 [Polyangiaceae bacterium]|nr:hypothetical protein [Polyangiaceae bacterium]